MRSVREFAVIAAVAAAGVLGLASVALACVPGHDMTPEQAKAMGQPAPGTPAAPVAAAATPPAPVAASATPAAPSPAAAAPATHASTSSPGDAGSSVLTIALAAVGAAIVAGVFVIMRSDRRSRKAPAPVPL